MVVGTKRYFLGKSIFIRVVMIVPGMRSICIIRKEQAEAKFLVPSTTRKE